MDDSKGAGMNLDKLWDWGQKKLNCRMRVESGNPAADALRDDLHKRLAELANVNLHELLADMKKKKDVVPDKKIKQVRTSAFVLGSSKSWEEKFRREIPFMEDRDSAQHPTSQHASHHSDANEEKTLHAQSMPSLSSANIHKKFFAVPKSPPRRVLLDLIRERAKPPLLLEQLEMSEPRPSSKKVSVKLPAKKKQSRMSAIEMLTAKLEKSMALESTKGSTATINTKFKDYSGDQFSNRGDYLDGMLYLSRMPDSTAKKEGTCKLGAMILAMDRDGKRALAVNKTGMDPDVGDESDSKLRESSVNADADDSSDATDISTKLYCAASLCNWSRVPQNAQQLANEGAVRAVVQLCNESNVKILKFCAASFRYMSDSSVLGTLMIEENAISVMSDLVSNANSEFVSGSIVIGLINLTRISGKEGQLVDFGMVLALQNVISIRPDLNAACARALYNLTCVDNSYPSMERVIRVLVSLSSSGTSTVKHVCAAALCNLADIKTVRLRMVEEGVISVLSALVRGSETKTRRVCAVILQNLSATKACRVEMVSRNCVQVAYGLSSDQDPIVLRCIGITLARLAQEETNCARMINEGGISALCNIAIKYPIVPGISQTVASAMQLISSHTKLQFSLVSEGSVTAIASLLRLSTDIVTLQQSLLALCNVLSSKDTHLSIVQQGMLNTLMTLSEHENETMRSLCTLAFLNLSANDDSYKHMVNSGVISSLITLSAENAQVIRRRCSATLCNISNYEAGVGRMISDGIVPALVRLMETEDIDTLRNVCAALCRLCNTVENGKLILDSGAIPYVVQGALTGDEITRQYCGSLISVLTAYDSCRMKLCSFGIVDALKSLSEQDDHTKQRCLVAFANLSCESSLHEEMISKGVIGIISKLVNSYQELNQICCATAICNLAYIGSRLKILTEGGLQALLMISMVRSVNNHTKMLCVVAMSNLFEDSTTDFLLNDGLIGAIANLCKVQDDAILHLSAKIFNKFSLSAKGRLKMIEKSNVIVTLFGLVNSEVESTRVLCAHSVCNLVMSESLVRQKCIKFGALAALVHGMQLKNEEASFHCVEAVNCIALIIQHRWMIAKTKLPAAVIELCMTCSGEKYERCSKIICMLAWANGSRFMLQNSETMSTFMSLIKNNMQPSSAVWHMHTLEYLTFSYYDHLELMEMGIFNILKKLLQYPGNELLQSAACIIRSLLETKQCIPILANTQTIHVFEQIVEKVKDSETLYNIASALYKFTEISSESRVSIATSNITAILKVLSADPQCYSLVAAIIQLFTTDPKCTPVFCNFTIVEIGSHILDCCPGEDEQVNVVLSLYQISKLPAGRMLLSGPPTHIDMKIMTLLKTCSPKIKSSCSKVLKNLSSDNSEEIEAGAVAALIALSFETKGGNLNSSVEPPQILAMDARSFKAPVCTKEVMASVIFEEEFVVQKCSDVGRGPPPPEPPTLGVEGAKDLSNIMDEIDCGEQPTDGRTLMTFAKMQVPQTLKENYLLDNSDFELHSEAGDDGYSWEEEASDRVEEEDGAPVADEGVQQQVGNADNDGVTPLSAASSPQKEPKTMGKATTESQREVLLKDIASQHGLYA